MSPRETPAHEINHKPDGCLTANPKVSEPQVCVAMLGARLHYAVPVCLEKAGLLDRFYTDTYLGNKPVLQRLLTVCKKKWVPPLLQRLCDRTADSIPGNKVVSFDLLGLWYLWKRYRACLPSDLDDVYAKAGRLFCRQVVQRGLGDATVVWGFNGASLEIFRNAGDNRVRCILEQTVAPRRTERQLLTEEMNRWPAWQPGLAHQDERGADPLAEREEAEWPLADRIVCGSSFVADALQALGVPAEKCHLIPYGIDTEQFQSTPKRPSKNGVNVLFVGEVGLRKGVPYLLEALKLINSPIRVHARLVGPVALNQKRLSEYRRWCEAVGPVPRSRILEMYDWADLFVLPSLCEGSATVTYEALACGLPVITTPNAGSVVRDSQEGFISPIRDAENIAKLIEQFIVDGRLWSIMSENARKRIQDFTLESYGERLLELFGLERN